MNGRRPDPNEEVVLRRAHPVFSGKWKVTSRYTVHMSARKSVRCVRVSSLDGNAVLHFSEDEFARLYKPWASSKSSSRSSRRTQSR